MKQVAERPRIGRSEWHYSDVGVLQIGVAGTPGTP
jgi:hypothetical protein